MLEKRKTKRRNMLYFTRIFDAVSGQKIGNLVDITPRGIMIVGGHLIPEGQTTRLRMELTNAVAEKPFMEFSACSKWSKRDVNPDLVDSGFEILDLAPEDAGIIQRIVESFGIRDNDLVS